MLLVHGNLFLCELHPNSWRFDSPVGEWIPGELWGLSSTDSRDCTQVGVGGRQRLIMHKLPCLRQRQACLHVSIDGEECAAFRCAGFPRMWVQYERGWMLENEARNLTPSPRSGIETNVNYCSIYYQDSIMLKSCGLSVFVQLLVGSTFREE